MGTWVFSLIGLFPYDKLSENFYWSLYTFSTDCEASVDSRPTICDTAIISCGEFKMRTLQMPFSSGALCRTWGGSPRVDDMSEPHTKSVSEDAFGQGTESQWRRLVNILVTNQLVK